MKRNKFVRQEPPKLGYGSYSMVTLSNPLIQLSIFICNLLLALQTGHFQSAFAITQLLCFKSFFVTSTTAPQMLHVCSGNTGSFTIFISYYSKCHKVICKPQNQISKQIQTIQMLHNYLPKQCILQKICQINKVHSKIPLTPQPLR